jgi:hypothetical protein
MVSAPGPDFLCIGAPKTGTTWLYKHLAAHPRIWMPPIKELHYFDSRFPLPRAGEKVNVSTGLLGLFPQHPRRQIVRALARSCFRMSLKDLVWSFRYFSGVETDERYCALFGRAERITGDLTTDYCALSSEAVQHVRALLPDVKIIFLMRNPIDRAWSHAKMLLPELLGKPPASISSEEFLAYLRHPAPRSRGDYLRTLKNWGEAFPPEQFFIGFFEDLTGQPQSFLREILRFLDIAPETIRSRTDLAKPVNAARSETRRGMPEEIAQELAGSYLSDLRALAGRFGSHASVWLASAERILSGHDAAAQVPLTEGTSQR